MAHVVTQPCRGCKYTDCVAVCPCECFYGDADQLYIDPGDCIDCGACVAECPASAIFIEESVPERWRHFVPLNAERAGALKGVPGAHVTEKVGPAAG
jgi:ferredoxin